jgi:two-component system sensor kinase FixL
MSTGPDGTRLGRAASAYAVAVGGVGLIYLMRFDPATWLRPDATLWLTAAVVLAASALGGAGAGLLATGLGLIAAFGFADAVALGLFAVLSAGLVVFGERMRVTRARTAIDARRLREREAHLQSILDTVPDAMIVADEKGVMQSISSTAERLFGWPQSDAVGQNLSVLMPTPYKEAHDSYMARYLATGEKRIIGLGRVVVGQRRDGTVFRMHLSVGEMRVGERRFFTGFVRDLTEQEQTEARLQELQAELVHISRLTAMGEMASALAHELNQPLSAIANYLRGCRRLLDKNDPLDRPRLSEALGKAADQAVRAGEVIQRLRQFVGRGETERRVERLPTLIEEASALALVGARELGVRVTMTFDPGCETALVDRVQIQQVVVNLMRNAVDAMRDVARRELNVQLSPAPGGFIAVTISDTGSGITDEALPRLFEPFMTTKKEGMGVGLSICKTIIESHGGAIWAQNNPSGGATFAFTLPNITEAAGV